MYLFVRLALLVGNTAIAALALVTWFREPAKRELAAAAFAAGAFVMLAAAVNAVRGAWQRANRGRLDPTAEERHY